MRTEPACGWTTGHLSAGPFTLSLSSIFFFSVHQEKYWVLLLSREISHLKQTPPSESCENGPGAQSSEKDQAAREDGAHQGVA